MSRVPILLLVVGAAGAVGCVYYNGMWSAEQLAKEARRAEQRGSPFDARSFWARAAVKAESVVVQHPRSRWAEPALVLQGEALAKSGACDRAAVPLGAAARAARSDALRERAALAQAECTLAGNAPATVARQVADVMQSRDAGRRSEAAFLTGPAARGCRACRRAGHGQSSAGRSARAAGEAPAHRGARPVAAGGWRPAVERRARSGGGRPVRSG